MKKTIHINLSGMAFRIEDDAYDRLKAYMDAVETRLGADEAARETLDDIEARMAELFIPVTRQNEIAVTLADVEEVIKILGAPEDYATDTEPDDDEPVRKKKADTPIVVPKRLYRDPHSRVLAGVCSGLGAYFNIDPILFRLLFILGLFYGISILPYIILWIVMPKALTMEQRMQMYGGEPAYSKTRQAWAGGPKPDSGINKLLRVFAVIFGIILIGFTFLAMMVMAMSLMFTNLFISIFPNSPDLGGLMEIFLAPNQSLPILIGLALTIGIPLIMIFYLGLHLVFQFRKGGKTIGTLGLILWLSGISLLAYGGFKVAELFKSYAYVEETTILSDIGGSKLYLQASDFPEVDYFHRNRNMIKLKNMEVAIRNGDFWVEGRSRIRVVKNAPHLAITLERQGRGKNEADAEHNASMTEYSWQQKDSILRLDKVYTLNRTAKFRDQKLTVRIEVPEGTEVEIDESVRKIVYMR